MVFTDEEKRERRRISQKTYREKHKEIIKEKFKEKKKEYRKQYNQTPNAKKSCIVNSWKHRGLICDDYNLLYSNYLSETHCDECRCRFGVKGDGTGTFKSMDHSHETGLFRNFLCNRCNILRR